MATLHNGSAVVVVRDAMTGDREFTNKGQKLVRFGDGSEKAVNAEDLYEGDPDEHRRKSGGLAAVGVQRTKSREVDWGKKRSVRPASKVSAKTRRTGGAKKASGAKKSGARKARAPKPAKTVDHGSGSTS